MTESVDEQLVAALCRDGRADVRDIAAATDTVPTTVQKRLEALERNGTIGGYTANVRYDRLGYEAVVFRLAVGLEAIDDVTERLRRRRPFVTVYQMSDAETVFAIAKFETEADLAACVQELHDDDDVRRIETDRIRSIHCENRSPLVDR